jgi:Tol biopolymer transport system component
MLIASTRADENPQYSPDGNRILLSSNRSGNWELWLCDSDGLNPVQLTSTGESTVKGFPSWSPDGRQIAFDSNLKKDWNVYLIDSEGGTPRPLTIDGGADTRPSWSRDSRWVYFASNRTGTNQVWKVLAEGGRPAQITREGGNNPVESCDGKFVYYSKATIPPSIWRVPAEGGEETLVLDDYPRADYANWVPVDDGIYFATWEGHSGSIKFLSFDTAQVADVVPLDSQPAAFFALAISPDGRWFLLPQYDQIGHDLMLLENFR